MGPIGFSQTARTKEADGGKGVRKGAAIGGSVGAVAGTLYGINEHLKADQGYRTASATCMRARG